jgi:hypothetical protein
MKLVILSVLVVALLIFGCGGQAQQNAQAPAASGNGTDANPPAPAAGNAEPPAASPAPAPQPTPEPAQQPAPQPAPPSGGTFDPTSLSSWDYGALVASGASVRCDVTYASGSGIQNSVLFIKGQKVRSEAIAQGIMTVSVIKDNVAYVKMSQLPNCDWFKTEINQTEQPS